MNDYPDHTRLFHLVGTSITIPINIEASDVTLDVNLAATEIALSVLFLGQWIDLEVNIVASDVTLDVNIESQDANITINFSDQSVAVFDAAKWFAHQAAQLFVHGLANVPQNSELRAIQYTVPAGKNLFVVGLGYRTEPLTAVMYASGLDIRIGATKHVEVGSVAGAAVIFDTPVRFTTGQVVDVYGHQYSSMANVYFRVEMWGYLEDE